MVLIASGRSPVRASEYGFPDTQLSAGLIQLLDMIICTIVPRIDSGKELSIGLHKIRKLVHQDTAVRSGK